MAAVRAPVRPARRSAPRPPLRVVKGKKKGPAGSKGRRGRRGFAIPVVVCTVLIVFGVTALHATMTQDGFRAAKLEREVQLETERTQLLRARVAQLANAERIANEASELGLVGDPDARFLKVPMPASERLTPVAPGQPTKDPIKRLEAGAK